MYDDDANPPHNEPFLTYVDEPADTPFDIGQATAGSPAQGRVKRAVTGVAIGLTVLATGGVAIAATHTGSGTSQGGGPGGAGGGPGGPGGGAGFGGPGGGAGGNGGFGPPGGGPGAAPGNASGPASSGTTTATASAAPGEAASTTADAAPAQGPRGMGGGVLVNALHGTFVVPGTSTTATVTEDLQRGSVTAISATSITVESSDGFTKTWVIGSGTTVDHRRNAASKIKSGDSVLIIANDSTGTALSIDDDALSAAAGTGAASPGGTGGPAPAGTGGAGGPAPAGPGGPTT